MNAAIYLFICVGLLLFSLIVYSLFLWLGIYWAKVDAPTFKAACWVTLMMTVVNGVISGSLTYFELCGDEGMGDFTLFFLLIISQILVVHIYFGTTVLRAIQALVPTILAPLLLVLFFDLGFKTLIGDHHYVPTNSMAPTIFGEHIESKCPECGETELMSVEPHYDLSTKNSAHHCICRNFHKRKAQEPGRKQLPGDRIFVAKFLKPGRWDVAAFELPSDRSITYIKRIVGLPGETIHIEKGSVFANGKQLEFPPHLTGLNYVTRIGMHDVKWGTKNNPAVLGPDEYFVLGDNTEGALDSRFWDTGAPGHNPYAVPESHLQGVPTVVFWPPKRWQEIR